jgi:tetratricopeptide (TPR) repeat protein
MELEARMCRVEALLALGEIPEAAREAPVLLAEADLRFGARLRGDLHILAAHVRRRLGDLEGTASLLMAARGLYEAIGDGSRLGRALLLLGEVYRDHGQVDLAVDAARRAVGCFEGEGDREAERCARHNLAIYLCDAGRPGEAWEELVRSRELLGEGVEGAVLLSSRWVEGRIREELGEVEAAEGLYRRVRRGFLERGVVREAVRVSLDLAGLWVETGRAEEAEEVATWLEAVSRGEPGLKAVAVEAVGLREAIREREPVVGLLRRLARLGSLLQ